MGGIFGFVGAYNHYETKFLNRMANAMTHRGDAVDTVSMPPFYGGVVSNPWETDTRIVTSADKSVVAVCEGEVYNPQELVDICGTEINDTNDFGGFDLILPLYKKYGRNFARYVNGIFSIALYDFKQNRLFLARDHLGSHSIFYVKFKDSILFGSTILSLFRTGLVDQTIDKLSLDRYLASLAISPPYTMFKKVKAVRPGHVVQVSVASLGEYEYWPLKDIQENYGISEAQLAEEVKEIFQDAVKIRAEHGGCIGLLISGGIDTSSIAAILSETKPNKQLKGFSVAFEERQFSDAHLQDIIYSRFAIEPNRILLGPDDFANNLIEAVRFLDSPVNDVAFAGMYGAFREAARIGCTAVFEGEGSDEIFCTGHSYGELNIQPYLMIPYPIRRIFFRPAKRWFSDKGDIVNKAIRFLARIGMSDLERRSTWIPGFPWNVRKKLLGISYNSDQTWDVAKGYYQDIKLNDAINIYQYGLTKLFLPDDLLFKNERMASATGIVNRTPFIDYRLVEKAFEVPARYKIQPPTTYSDGTKLIFKKAMRGIVPDEILDRKKTRGFSQPTAVWFRSKLKDFVYEHLFSRKAMIFDWLDKKEVERIYNNFISNKFVNDYFINSLIILEVWMQSHLK